MVRGENEMISVIIPIYNVENYLERCIESIKRQTYQNLEIILVDDGSTDKSSEICEIQSSLDKRIKVIHQKNSGVSAARNRGIDIAMGDYLCFVDSDDFIHSELLETLYKISQREDADIVTCEYQPFSQYEEIEEIQIMEFPKTKNASGREALNWLFDDKRLGVTVVWNKLYKRKIFSDIRFPEGKIHEDQFTTYQLLYKAEKVSYVNLKLYYYLQRENSIMHGDFSAKRLDAIEALQLRNKFILSLNDKDLYGKAVNQLLCLMIFCYYNLSRDYSKEIEQLELNYIKTYKENRKFLLGNRNRKFIIRIFYYMPSFMKKFTAKGYKKLKNKTYC